MRRPVINSAMRQTTHHSADPDLLHLVDICPLRSPQCTAGGRFSAAKSAVHVQIAICGKFFKKNAAFFLGKKRKKERNRKNFLID